MSRLKTALLGLGVSVGAVAIAHAGTVLNLKAGLWETAALVTMSMPGMPNMPQVKPVTNKSCVTEKELEDLKNFAPANRPDCKQTILKSTSSEIQAKIECTGKDAANMTGTFKSSAPTAFSGVLNGTVTEEGQTIPISNTIQGKWLGADCGSVKPMKAD